MHKSKPGSQKLNQAKVTPLLQKSQVMQPHDPTVVLCWQGGRYKLLHAVWSKFVQSHKTLKGIQAGSLRFHFIYVRQNSHIGHLGYFHLVE